jgi:hypothetical protein
MKKPAAVLSLLFVLALSTPLHAEATIQRERSIFGPVMRRVVRVIKIIKGVIGRDDDIDTGSIPKP